MTATGQVGEYSVGSLVHIRKRDWVVLPSDDADILCLRPLSGSESEICGIHRVESLVLLGSGNCYGIFTRPSVGELAEPVG